MRQLDTFDERMYAAQTARDRLEQLHNLTLAVEVLGDAVKALDDQLSGVVAWLDSFVSNNSN